MTTAIQHTDMIFWPNGEGCTPCSQEYADTMAKRDAIKGKPQYDGLALSDGFLPMDYLTPDDYNEYCRLDSLLDSMQMSGHVGESERF